MMIPSLARRATLGAAAAALLLVPAQLLSAAQYDDPPATSSAQPAPLQGEDAKLAQQLSAQILQLRQQGKYADALPIARQLLELRVRLQGEKWYETSDARQNVKTLEHIATLAQGVQQQLAEADRGDKFLSGTVTAACDRFIEDHYPGALKGAA